MASPADTFWTAERVERLRTLWTAGHTGGQISASFDGLVTRSAVIGKVHRLGLGGRSQNSNQLEARRQRKLERMARPKDVLFRKRVKPRNPNVFTDGTERTELKPDPVPGRFHLLELEEHQCRWPSGHADNGTHLFCGETRFPGSSYCEFHAYRATARTEVKEPMKTQKGWSVRKSALVV